MSGTPNIAPSESRAKTQLRLIGEAVRANIVEMLEVFESDEHLTGLCAVASIALAKSLHRFGIKPLIVEGYYAGEHHCWVCAGEFIVDLTLTQFLPNSEPVFITTSSEDHYGIKEWESIQLAEESTWVAECEIDWDLLVVAPDLREAMR